MSVDSKTVAFYTLGCKVNQYDSAAVASLFKESGFTIVPFDEKADVYVVNTCTVTATGDKKSRQALRRARRHNPRSIVVAMGCYSQTNPEEVASETGADLVFGTGDHDQIVDSVIRLMAGDESHYDDSRGRVRVRPVCEYTTFHDIPAHDAMDRTRAFVKIQDGCEQHCTYCKVPQARGRVRSRDLESILRQVRSLVGLGYREVVLIGIHLGVYGRDLGPEVDLARAVRLVAGVEGLVRVRLGSIECTELTPALLDAIASHPNVCRHLHVPLQSGDDGVLARMGRPYDTQKYLASIAAARDIIPGCAVSTDVMVGFPGESDREFARSIEFVEQCGFTRLHVFGYSKREGTPAASAPDQVPPQTISTRIQLMGGMGKRLAMAHHQSMVGRTFEVLVEGVDSATSAWFGHTDSYVRVSLRGCGEACPHNELVSARVVSADAEGVFGVCEGKATLT